MMLLQNSIKISQRNRSKINLTENGYLLVETIENIIRSYGGKGRSRITFGRYVYDQLEFVYTLWFCLFISVINIKPT